MPERKKEPFGFFFMLERGDTVYAARRGVVVRVETDPGTGDGWTARVIVEHRDGSFAGYACLDPDHLFVSQGDPVFADTPLAFAGSCDGELYSVCMKLFFLVSEKYYRDLMDFSFGEKQFFAAFASVSGAVMPTIGGIYTPFVDETLVTCEMTKKEIKRWRGNKK